MNRIIKKDEILTIPNMMSIFRILLLPLIVWFYNFEGNRIAAIIILLISGLSDIVDGFIARKFNMVSDLGKIIDPIADKMTQGIMLICLIFQYKQVFVLLGVFILKEFLMTLLGWITIKRKRMVNSAKWYGKLNTVIIYSVIFFMIIIPSIPDYIVNIMIIVCIAVMVMSFTYYVNMYNRILSKDKSVKA